MYRRKCWFAAVADADLIPQQYVAVLAGYTLERATCGLVKAATHRVVSSCVLAASKQALLAWHCSPCVGDTITVSRCVLNPL